MLEGGNWCSDLLLGHDYDTLKNCGKAVGFAKGCPILLIHNAIYPDAKIFPAWPFHNFTPNAKRISKTKNSGHLFISVYVCDLWSSSSSEPYLSLKIHLIEEWKLCRLCLQMTDSNAGSPKNWNFHDFSSVVSENDHLIHSFTCTFDIFLKNILMFMAHR